MAASMRPRLARARAVRRRAQLVRDSWRALDDEVFAARLGAVAFGAGGAAALLLHLVPDEFTTPQLSVPVAVLAMLLGAIAWRLPWARWTVDAQLAFPLAGFVLTAAATRGQPRAGVVSVLDAFTVLFVVTGFAQRPGRCVLLAPMALLAALVALPAGTATTAVLDIEIGVGVSVAAGEAIALVRRRQRRADQRVRGLLEAVRTLGALDDVRAAPHRIADVVVDLLAADAAVVLLRESGGSARLVNRARAGHPALTSSVPPTLRAAEGPCARALLTGEVVVVDEHGAQIAGPGRPRPSLAVVPLRARQASFGCVLVMWNRPHLAFSRSTRDAAELLGQEAGRMLARLARHEQLAREARTDALTTLANRRTFAQVLERLVPGDVVVVIDLDHFKHVNDTYGHPTGDVVLRDLAECLRQVARQGDTLARYGGEEFALVLPGGGATGARVLLARLRRAWDDVEPLTTFSAGIAVHRRGAPAAETLARADAALYAAKHGGRNRDELAPDVIDLTTPASEPGGPASTSAVGRSTGSVPPGPRSS